MEDQYGQQHQQQPQPRTRCCYRHPDRETGVSCTRCDRPICPECMIAAAVGFQCPSCVSGGSGTGHPPGAQAPRTLAGGLVRADTRLVTKVLLGLNLAVFLAVLAYGEDLVVELMMLGQFPPAELLPPRYGVAEGEWYRLLTGMFLHEEVWHLGFNMLALLFLGPPLEAALGRSRFTLLYLLSGLGGDALTYVLADPAQGSLGASGAIFGLFGATAVLAHRLRRPMAPIALLLAINLVFTFAWDNIAWESHIGGLVVGVVLGLALVHAPRQRRALVQYGSCAAVLLVVLLTCLVRTVQLVA